MRKTIFTALVVLLAMLAVTCDSALLPGKLSSGSGQSAPNEPGKSPAVDSEFVTLTVSTTDSSGQARALIDTAASGSSNFYEVVFVSPGKQTYRQTWDTSGTPAAGDGQSTFTITVAVGNYSGGNNQGHAVMFAGNKTGSDYTLLGVGVLTAPAGKQIGPSTTQVTFTLYPLKAAVNTTPGPGAGASSFLITAPGDYVSSSTTLTTIGSGPVYPLFRVPMDVSLTAKYLVTCDAATNNYVVVAGGDVYFSALYDDFQDAVDAATTGSDIFGSMQNTNNLSTAIGSNGFTFTFKPPISEEGFTKLYIEVPVFAINDVTGKQNNGGSAGLTAIDWYIKGGLANTTVDPATGAAAGGAVLLQVYEATTDVTPNPAPPGWIP